MTLTLDQLAAKVADLEQQVAAFSADSLNPNVLQVLPDGTIGALLTGGLLLTEGQGPPPNPPMSGPSSVAWEDSTQTVHQYLQGNDTNGIHGLSADAVAGFHDYAQLYLDASVAGINIVGASAGDSAAQPDAAGAVIINSRGASSFLQLATIANNQLHLGTAVATAGSWGPGTWTALSVPHGVGFQPSWAHATIIPGGAVVNDVYIASGYTDAANINFYGYNSSPFNLSGGTLNIGFVAIL